MVSTASTWSGCCSPGCYTWSSAGFTSASLRPGCRDWPERRDGAAIHLVESGNGKGGLERDVLTHRANLSKLRNWTEPPRQNDVTIITRFWLRPGGSAACQGGGGTRPVA